MSKTRALKETDNQTRLSTRTIGGPVTSIVNIRPCADHAFNKKSNDVIPLQWKPKLVAFI